MTKKTRQQAKVGPSAQSAPKPTITEEEIISLAEAVRQFAQSNAPPDETKGIKLSFPSLQPEWAKTWEKLETAFQLFEQMRLRHEQATTEITGQRKIVDETLAKLQQDSLNYERQLTEVAGREKVVAEKWPQVEALASREQTVTEQAEQARTDKAEALKRQEEAQKARAEIEQQTEVLAVEQAQLEADQTALQTERAQWDELKSQQLVELKKLEGQLIDQKQELNEREANALAGFVTQKRQAAESLQAQVNLLQEQHRALSIELIQKSADTEKELQRLYEAAEADLADQRHRNEALQLELRQNKVELQQAKAILEDEKVVVAEMRATLEQIAERKAARQIEDLKGALKETQEKYLSTRDERDRLYQVVHAQEQSNRRVGGQSLEEILKQLDDVKRERDEFEKQLAARPTANSATRLETLEREYERLDLENSELKRQLQDHKRRLAGAQIPVIELETLTDQKKALELSRDRLKGALEELKQDYEKAKEEDKNKPVLPECTRMDGDESLQNPVPVDSAYTNNLKDLAEKLRHWIGYDLKSKEPDQILYYDLADIRSFLAGLAMSKLMLLQGISGIGKTSLPVNFARAVGGGREIIEVQAGWRDRHDLLGHYNSFRNEFHESRFLRALYQAQCPAYADRIYLIILDEMNLSYPEQYFADLLSALEQKSEDRKLELVSKQINRRPRLLMADGKSLHIPDNVWFIGTANQDETTKGFADKTYDRAHVLDLPSGVKPFAINRRLPQSPTLSYKSLKTAFQQAIDNVTYKEAAGNTLKYLEQLDDPLRLHLKVGWGNRLEAQLHRYVPVVMAAGGSIGEALDYVLAMKILRKIRDRHDTNREHLNNLRKKLVESWSKLDAREYSEPHKSLAVLDAEVKRKEAM